MSVERAKRKEQIATVVSDKMDKSVVVVTKSHVKHPRYGKYYLKRTKFSAHDETNSSKVGDTVKVRETRPLSKTKNWKVVEVIKKTALSEEDVVIKA